jgi:CheY-like chemotaxis protein
MHQLKWHSLPVNQAEGLTIHQNGPIPLSGFNLNSAKTWGTPMLSQEMLPIALVVESNVDRREIALTLLEESGLEPYSVTDASEAEAFVRRYAHRVGFLFVDDGSVDVSSLLRAIKATSSHASIAATNVRTVHDPAVIHMGSDWSPLDLLIAAGIALEWYERTVH